MAQNQNKQIDERKFIFRKKKVKKTFAELQYVQPKLHKQKNK